jgi:hypothetical protein
MELIIMKKQIAVVLIVGIAAAVAFGATGIMIHGFGRELTATTTPAVLELPPSGTRCSVEILTEGVVYFAKNTTTNFYNITNTIAIRFGSPYTFKESNFTRMCYSTKTNSVDFSISFE